MKDIKAQSKIIQEKVSRVTNLFVNENTELRVVGNTFGKYIFGGMVFSVLIYLFFVTSSIFYAINTQKYFYEIEALNTLALEIGSDMVVNADKNISVETYYVEKKDRISYINKNADTAISLK